MRKNYIVLSNNPKLEEMLLGTDELMYKDISFEEILLTARDMIHRGHKLLSHPLSGSVKPIETPYKSLMLSKESSNLDLNSLTLIEKAIESVGKFEDNRYLYTEDIKRDFQTVDLDLIKGAIASADA